MLVKKYFWEIEKLQNILFYYTSEIIVLNNLSSGIYIILSI